MHEGADCQYSALNLGHLLALEQQFPQKNELLLNPFLV